MMVNDVAVFPALDRSVWRSDWPYIVTLVDGVKLPAYPVRGLVDERGSFCFGDSCNDEMWYVADRLIEHCLITIVRRIREQYGHDGFKVGHMAWLLPLLDDRKIDVKSIDIPAFEAKTQ